VEPEDIKNKGTLNEWFDEAYSKFESQGKLVAGPTSNPAEKRLLKYSDLKDFLINEKGLSTELTDKFIQDIKDGVFAPAFPEATNPKNRGILDLDFVKGEGLADVGISRSFFHMESMQKHLDNIYTPEIPATATSVSELSYTDRQLLQDNFYKSLKDSDDVVEIYLRQISRVNVPAESIYFRPKLVQEVPGFYTEPIGGLSSGDMASGGGIRPTENYYRLEVNKNNLLIDVPGFDFNNELKTKLDWNLLEKELGINYSQFKGTQHNYQSFHNKLRILAEELGIDNTKLYSTLRKSGYEGTVGYVNRQVEVVLLDPNDDIGIGKKVNFENSTIDDFYNNKQTVNPIDELVIKPNTPTNVVDDLTPNQLADNFFDSLNKNTTGNVEFYVKHAGGNVPANEIKFSHKMGGVNHIPGFYTEPIGNKTLNQIRGPGNFRDAVDNFYKVQVNTDNLLINIKRGEFRGADVFVPKSGVGGAAPLGDQIEKIDWDIFFQETGVSFDDLVAATKNKTPQFFYDKTGRRSYGGGVEVFTKVLAQEVELAQKGNLLLSHGFGDTNLTFTALRKAGIEGFVTGPTNAQYEVVLLDPNDDLGIGKRINIEDTTVEQFKTSQATANQIDEIIIDTPTNVGDEVDRSTIGQADDPYFDTGKAIDTPTNLGDDVVEGTVTSMEEYRFKKLIEEVEEATPDVTKITPEQAGKIDDAITEARALLNRDKFKIIQGTKGSLLQGVTYDQVFKALGYKLKNIFSLGLTLTDLWELGLLVSAVGDPALDKVVELIFPPDVKDERTYFERVMNKLDLYADISPTEQAILANKESRARKYRPEEVEASENSYNEGEITYFQHTANLDTVLEAQKSYVYRRVTPNIGMVPVETHNIGNSNYVMYTLGSALKGEEDK